MALTVGNATGGYRVGVSMLALSLLLYEGKRGRGVVPKIPHRTLYGAMLSMFDCSGYIMKDLTMDTKKDREGY